MKTLNLWKSQYLQCSKEYKHPQLASPISIGKIRINLHCSRQATSSAAPRHNLTMSALNQKQERSCNIPPLETAVELTLAVACVCKSFLPAPAPAQSVRSFTDEISESQFRKGRPVQAAIRTLFSSISQSASKFRVKHSTKISSLVPISHSSQLVWRRNISCDACRCDLVAGTR